MQIYLPRGVRTQIASLGLLAFVAGAPSACKGGGDPDDSSPDADLVGRPLQVTIGAAVPHDVPGGERLPPSEASNDVLAMFAWEQFLALSWQSDYDTTTHSRGKPDTSWSFAKSYEAGKPLVWETFAHRTELRPFGVSLDQPFDKAPKYLFGNKDIQPATPGTSFTLFNNLDEDNEIGSCDVYLGPGDPSTQDLVLYQAKVNRAEYDYVLKAFGKNQQLPSGSDLEAAGKRNQASYKSEKKAAPNGIDLPAGDNSATTVEAEGAIEVKTAFLRVTPANEAELKGFYQTEAIYYTADFDAATGEHSNWKYHNGTFALLSIHVIHKTKSYPDFIFTSFEHKSLASLPFEYILVTPLPPVYADFNPHGAKPPAQASGGTQFGDRQSIVRQTGASPASDGQLYPIPPYLDAATKAVHAELRKINPDSVWLNYRLIGVQANITEKWASKPAADAGPNHFMANHVVESDAFLGNFFGPGFGTNPFPASPGSGNGDNVVFEGQSYNAGGCKGCHGVAQTAFGTDFSFLLDFGKGKPVQDPDTIHYHPEGK